MLCAIQYHLYNLKKLKNIHGRVLLLVKLYARLQPATLLKVTLFQECFSSFLNCINNTKSHNASHMSILISYRNNFSEYKILQDIAKIKTLSLISLKLTFSYLVGEQSHKLLLNGANSQRKIIFPSCNFLSPLEQPTGNTRNLLHYVNRWSPPPPPDVIYPNSGFKYPSW